MKNVSFDIIIILLLSFLICVLSSHVNAKSKQPVYTPQSMNSSDSFFNPQIGVCTTVGTECESYSDGDCKYKFPTFVKSYLKWPDDAEEKPKICACQVVFCSDTVGRVVVGVTTGLIGSAAALAGQDVDFAGCTTDLGCIPIPLAPGPPPFCDQFETSPEIRIVPVAASDRSLSQPKIRVIIGSPAKKCSSGLTISQSATCIDGSPGQIINPTAINLNVNTDGKESGNISIPYGGVTYIFRTYKEKDHLCAGFYGDSSKEQNIRLISSGCFPSPKVNKPELIPLDENGNELDNKIIGSQKIKANLNKVKVKVQGYNNPITLVYGAKEYNNNGLKLKLIKPKIDSSRSFIYDIKCSGGGNFSKDKGCPEGQSIDVGYNENSHGKVVCLSGWNSDEYVLQRKENKRIFKYLRSFGKQFNDYRVVKGQYIPCSKNPKDLDTMQQSDLDNIRPYDGNYYSIGNDKSPPCSDGSLCCDTSYSTIYKYEDIVFNQPFTSVPSEPGHYERVDLEDKNGGKVTYYVRSTRYINENTGQPFFLTKEELNDHKGEFFAIKDPYINNLCVDNFDRTSYTQPGEHYFHAIEEKKESNDNKSENKKEKKCQFITMEAWGGGTSGFIDKINPTNSTSGAAGDYAKATIKVDDKYPIFKIVVGNGSEGQNSRNGTSSEIYMCNNNKKGCNKLITAGSGNDSIHKQNASINNKDLVYTRFIGRPKGIGENNKISLPYQGKNDEKPHEALFQESDDCNKLDKSNTIKKIENNNKIPGSGGCINTDKLSYQEGANGKVIITCEQWE